VRQLPAHSVGRLKDIRAWQLDVECHQVWPELPAHGCEFGGVGAAASQLEVSIGVKLRRETVENNFLIIDAQDTDSACWRIKVLVRIGLCLHD
jgi:hypothetical protein